EFAGTGFYGDRSSVRATSLSARPGSTIKVRWFRGSGTGKESEVPLINSSHIYNVFKKESFSALFRSFIESEPAFEPKINPVSHFKYFFLKIKLILSSTYQSRMITNSSLSFFWGNRSLPNISSEECFDYTTSNTKIAISFCNVTQMDRCAANICDLPLFTPFKFLSTKEERFTQFSWLCPKGQICCAWECCDPVDNMSAYV
ncbi:hypothetical protein PFISCL1PPCAC_2483, partial [Pristionchus fissidentatus]